jgi:hypothetical protein
VYHGIDAMSELTDRLAAIRDRISHVLMRL